MFEFRIAQSDKVTYFVTSDVSITAAWLRLCSTYPDADVKFVRTRK